MDSQVVVKLIQGSCLNNQAFHFIIKECQDLLFNQPWEISFKHCYKEANRVADYLANLGVGQSPPLVIFDSPPSSIGALLFEDVSGVFWPRILRT